jgi:pyruvate formate lyase activating enzyme
MNVDQQKQRLDQATREGALAETLPGGELRCTACAHLCVLKPGQRGICKVRYNDGGSLRVPYNYTAGLHNDPIEKKPFFHVLPGSMAMSFGMLGCDFRCSYCQNWFTSQTLRDATSTADMQPGTPETICRQAQCAGARTVVSTYNEPLITSEWAVAVFKEARRLGLRTAYVSNGHGTEPALDYLRPWLDMINIDLKSFQAKNYHRLGGHLDAVLDTIRRVHAYGLWLEVVTLVVPGFNDSDRELADMAEFIASVSCYIPWHVTGFYPTYKMIDRPATATAALKTAREAGKRAGLKFVYSGNRPGALAGGEDTHCPGCGATLIARAGYHVLGNRLRDGACPECATAIPGLFEAAARNW